MTVLVNRRKKYDALTKTNQEQIRINIDAETIDTFCEYAISENSKIHISGLMNLKNLLDIIQTQMYQSNDEMLKLKYQFCRDAIDYRLQFKIANRNIIIKSVTGLIPGKYDSIDFNSFRELDEGSVNWVDMSVGDVLTNKLIFNAVDNLYEMCAQYKDSDLMDKSQYALGIRQAVTSLTNQFRKYDVESDENETEFLLSDPESVLDSTLRRMRSPSNKLRTGMQQLNQVLAGGFEGSRVYCFFGLPGEGKTTTLLNIAYQLKEYNKNYVCKDKTKRPCVVFFTMENSLRESIVTMYNIGCGQEDMRNFSVQEVMERMQEHGLGVSDDSPVDLLIKYKPIFSVDTNYLYELTEKLADRGMEVIAMVFDYIKRIKTAETLNNKEERFRLGQVINELKNYANYKDIPVITASQLNREGASTVDDLREKGKRDAITGVGRSNIGESSLIDENVDASIIIIPAFETKKDDTGNVIDVGNKWMGFKVTKTRYKINTEERVFYHPFYPDNPVKYICDVGLSQRLSRPSLINYDKERNRGVNSTVIDSNVMKQMGDLRDIDHAFPNGIIARQRELEEEEQEDLDPDVMIKRKYSWPIEFDFEPILKG